MVHGKLECTVWIIMYSGALPFPRGGGGGGDQGVLTPILIESAPPIPSNPGPLSDPKIKLCMIVLCSVETVEIHPHYQTEQTAP